MSKHYPKLRPILECLEDDPKQCRFYEKEIFAYGRSAASRSCEYRRWMTCNQGEIRYSIGVCTSVKAIEHYLEKQG